MTKKEAFINVVHVGTVDDGTAEMYLLSSSIVPEDRFNGDLKELELAAIPCLESLLPISSTSEGAFNEGRSYQGIKDRLLLLARKHSMDDIINSLTEKPIIKAYNGWGL